MFFVVVVMAEENTRLLLTDLFTVKTMDLITAECGVFFVVVFCFFCNCFLLP